MGVSFYKNGYPYACWKLANKWAKNKKPPLKINSTGVIRRDGKIRTCDLLVLNQALKILNTNSFNVLKFFTYLFFYNGCLNGDA